mgnify:CR=1 FL=1
MLETLSRGESMLIQSGPSEETVLSTFHARKILTIDELSELLHCSAITSRRRLKQWQALTSYNQNNRYYTLPSIPTFGKLGLWHYRGVFFSKHGTCKQTVVHFVRVCEKGLSNTELAEILGENPNSLLAHFREIPGLTKERHGRDIVYFSSEEEVYRRQQRSRFPPVPSVAELPPDAQAIIILVELIHHPRMKVDELATQLQHKGYTIKAGSIAALFRQHRIDKKKLSTQL